MSENGALPAPSPMAQLERMEAATQEVYDLFHGNPRRAEGNWADARWTILVCPCSKTIGRLRDTVRCPHCKRHPKYPLEVRLTDNQALLLALQGGLR